MLLKVVILSTARECCSFSVHLGHYNLYSLFTLRRARAPLILNGERALLRVNRLQNFENKVIQSTCIFHVRQHLLHVMKVCIMMSSRGCLNILCNVSVIYTLSSCLLFVCADGHAHVNNREYIRTFDDGCVLLFTQPDEHAWSSSDLCFIHMTAYTHIRICTYMYMKIAQQVKEWKSIYLT